MAWKAAPLEEALSFSVLDPGGHYHLEFLQSSELLANPSSARKEIWNCTKSFVVPFRLSVVLGIELRTSCVLGKCSAIEPLHPPLHQDLKPDLATHLTSLVLDRELLPTSHGAAVRIK